MVLIFDFDELCCLTAVCMYICITNRIVKEQPVMLSLG